MAKAGWILAAAALLAGCGTRSQIDANTGANAAAANAAAPAQNAAASAPAANQSATSNAVEAKPEPGLVAGLPRRVGECAMTRIEWIGTRLEDENEQPIADSGSAVRMENGVYGVSYDQIPAVDRSRVGDQVRTCLVSIPADCPPGDDRGREYHATNLRTNQEWTLPDAQHFCGGA